ncbi:hypothetical protein PHYBLDRAFT_139883 [Phycomyces blakesleeanus NRRL 1555(-)]|uniref:Reverse transcriptase domain-containing protein n=1 Tax=Phycomyces blakesleeanus (strain ATCC 8743b / DSM 1359 / FGSC 10004 / NBRC 33097 / NRRL 1555) TaxID=763407 RepID=A0A167QL71_PHYB8|nr:hypothetical protein PHYBLDRAFT_139883 [Phycomyces blakesleeanus NRRL 1555(-)]OAD79871.1 hypothetical protein PHYBLDRAFT_139883 [Phycomyces blakesleeanus NRRL 1555(-)]|eukprot:XP_018297911.1 hypothetical protein PHYBLDRAFT_139883 [Phycomyces blakesleeanus NRRL 1555(-)]
MLDTTGAHVDLSSYRPISLTLVFRKLLERYLAVKLLQTMPELDIAQGGFRASCETLDQALCLHELIRMYFVPDPKQEQVLIPSVVVFLDIKAAYDILKNVVSRDISPRHDVLQGSILSPFLYSLFIDTLSHFLQGVSTCPQLVRIPSPDCKRSLPMSSLQPDTFDTCGDPDTRMLDL